MRSIPAGAASGAISDLVAMSPLDVGQLAWRGVPNCPGVYARELSNRTGATVALIRYAPSASTPGRPHPTAEHHIWVLSGVAVFGGRRLVGGSYVFIAPGVDHPITATATGCTLLQVYVPVEASATAPVTVPTAA